MEVPGSGTHFYERHTEILAIHNLASSQTKIYGIMDMQHLHA